MTVENYRDAVKKGLDWLFEKQRSDGSFGDVNEGVDAYYKIPYAFQITGHAEKGLKLLDWVKENNLFEDGDFRSPVRKSMNDFHETYYIYPNCWLVKAAQKLGRFDVAFKGAEFIQSQQDLETGGIISRRRDLGDTTQDILSTSWGGLALLYTGKMDGARAAGKFLIHILKEQPEIDKCLYVSYKPGEGFITEGVDEMLLKVDAEKKQQNYFYPGMPLGFLCKLYLATGEMAFLEAAEGYFNFTMTCQEDVFASPPSGKLAFGSSVLYNITGNEEAKNAAERISDYIAGIQNPDGSWPHPWIGEMPLYQTIDLTAEFVIWLSEVTHNLESKV